MAGATGFTQLLLLRGSPAGLAFDRTARVAVLVAGAWLVLLWLIRSREPEILGSGATEYTRVVHASGLAFGILSIAFLVLQLPGLRMQIVFAFPLGLLMLMVVRWLWRKRLIRERAQGECLSRAIVAGTREDVHYVIERLVRDSHHGYLVIGATTTDGLDSPISVDGRSYPVVGTIDQTAAYGRIAGADTIVVASTPRDDRDFVRRLGWELEEALPNWCCAIASPTSRVLGCHCARWTDCRWCR
nr:hypothetical protein GCM10025699_06640 [Microbacterium flavescens]